MSSVQTTQRTEAQRRAADPSTSAWVTANAGAGKTFVLVDRVTRLLLAGTPPQRIVCLTFTRAAAAEMANRLLDRLGKWALLDDDALSAALAGLGIQKSGRVALAGARQLFAAALETPGGLKIQTIHAFCEAVLKRFPLEAGLPPHFDILDQRAAATIYREAIAQTLEESAQGKDSGLTHACDILARRLGEARLQTVVEKACTHRSFTILPRQESHDAIMRALGLRPDDNETARLRAACEDTAFDRPGLISASNTLKTGGTNDQKRAILIEDWLHQTVSQRTGAGWDTYLTAFLTQTGTAKSPLATKGIKKKDPHIDTILKTEQSRVLAVYQYLKTLRIAESSAALTLFATRVLKNYTSEKKRRASVDFDDLIIRTQALLNQNHGASWVMYKIDGGIDHILVDESQDTSPAQWNIIRSLSGEFFSGMGREAGQRSLFTVGDEKQSIFGFQGADPEYSLDVRDAFAQHFAQHLEAHDSQWSTIPLGLNFRSAPAVLTVVDRVFADQDRHYGVAEEWVQHRPHRGQAAGLVEWWDLADATDKIAAKPWVAPGDHDHAAITPAKHLVEEIADSLQAMINQGEILASTGKPVQAGDILILIQKRSGGIAEDLAQALKQRHIPVAGNDRLVLAEHLAVMDLCAAARFALHPEDDLNLAAVLKSPLCTPDHPLDEQDLMALCLDRLDRKESLWATLKKHAGQKTIWKNCYQRLSGWLQEADRTAPYDFFAARLATENGRRALLARQGPEAEEPIDAFLTLCLDYETIYTPSLQHYVHWFEQTAGTISRATDSPRNEVRIMTVHSAKGLESPVVFLADAARKVSRDHDFLWADPCPKDGGHKQNKGPVLLWPGSKKNQDSFCAGLSATLEKAGLDEYYRLLYVAMTRAQDRLYICGWKDQRSSKQGQDSPNPDQESWHAVTGAVLKKQGRSIDRGNGKTGFRYETGSSVTAAPSQPTQQPKPEQPEWLYQSAPREGPIPKSLTPSSARPHTSDPPGTAQSLQSAMIARKRGLLAHRLLEILPRTPVAARAHRARLVVNSFAPAVPPDISKTVLSAVFNVLDNPDIAPLFTPDCLTEVPVSGVIDGTMIRGRIDRLKVTPTDVTILDYKTGTVPKHIPRDIPPGDLAQIALYRRLCRRIYPDRRIHCILLWIDGPQFTTVSEEVLNQASPISAPHDPGY